MMTTSKTDALRILPLTVLRLTEWLKTQDASIQSWVQLSGFSAKSAEMCIVPNGSNQPALVLLGVADADDFWAFGAPPSKLQAQPCWIDNRDHFLTTAQYERAVLAWGLGSYHFGTYLRQHPTYILLELNDPLAHIDQQVAAICSIRDLINTPAQDMNTEHLAAVILELGRQHKAKVTVTRGKKLQTAFPALYAVGKGAEYEPQLIDLQWGNPSHPHVTVVGKGITFDTGGLDIKPSAGMRTMKKDMAGAAHAIGLARLIMEQRLPLRLRLIVPTAENAIGHKSYHPGDVIHTRAGYTVEIENTDAEGRLILCDALALAVEEHPAYLIDFATLTGAISVALGPDIPGLYSNNEQCAAALITASQAVCDPLWRMPLYKPYQSFFKSDIADLLNASTVPLGGSITAALFLQKFVPDTIPWMHIDFFAYNKDNRPGRPAGGEAMGIRAVFEFLKTIAA